jgi:Protein of unknown function (DUF3047)
LTSTTKLRRVALAALGLGLAVGACPAQPQVSLPQLPLPGTPGAWAETLLPGQKVPATQFTPTTTEGVTAWRIEADASYGTLVHALPADAAAARTLAWRWRVDRFAEGADLQHKAGDDAAVKICAMFDLPLQRVPFLERQTLRLARAAAGVPLPAATLCYVWDARLPAGTVLPNVYSRRMRWMVLQGPGGTGGWRSERRDLHADFLRAFGDEADGVPPLTHLVVGADADNTHGRSLAWVAGLELVR